VPIVFDSGWNALQVDEEVMTIPVALQPRYVFDVLSEHAEALLASLDGAATMRGRVEALLVPLLHTGAAGIDAVAAKLGISRQTLYRRLKAEGATFEAVRDSVRHRLALDYLGAGKASVAETAWRLGFSDRAAFSRAFKRWTGAGPGARRAEG
jgi:AraC-like DNA-binding protein